MARIVTDLENLVPQFGQGQTIPKIIHQTYHSRDLPSLLEENVDHIKSVNPAWSYKLYDDEDIVHFIKKEYGEDILQFYDRINPRFGAARADLFRYLLLYKIGGVYLDIKSTTNRGLDSCLRVEDRYILSHWQNEVGAPREGWGLHAQLSATERGEYQQWHIICVAGHPFLRAVIAKVLAGINAYRPWHEGLGQRAVIQVTGPIAYTLAIQPILGLYPHRLIGNEKEIGLEYSILSGFCHTKLSQRHYVYLDEPLIHMTGLAHIQTMGFLFVRSLRDRLYALRVRMRCLLRLGD